MGYNRPRYYTINHQTTSAVNPIDSTAYYSGGAGITWSTVANQRQTTIVKSGVIREIQVIMYATAVTGTNENWTISLTDGTTTTAIATVGAATTLRTFRNSNLNFPVTEGGYVQLVMTTPNWVTNPEGIMSHEIILVEVA